jgi:UDP-N-acetylmuramyl-tripeptide synthetase
MVFVALAGLKVDGHKYVGQAAANGCAAVVVEAGHAIDLTGYESLPVLEVTDSRAALGEIAAAFYGNPAQGMVLIGITGTNGKTTTTYLLESIIKESGGNPGVIGTINYRFNGKEFPAPFTTPEPVLLQEMLRNMADGGVSHVIMETSSHALSQKRLSGLEFDVALFTNLSRDHLDFHGSMEDYYLAKKGLFAKLKRHGHGTAVVVVESAESEGNRWGRRLLNELESQPDNEMKIISCGLVAGMDVCAGEVKYGISGTTAQINVMGKPLSLASDLVGEFNLKNIIGAVGAAAALGFDIDSVGQGLKKAGMAPGRLERIVVDSDKSDMGAYPEVFVDYAHTPDALENVLRTLRNLINGRLLVAFGCGGDRDKGKRYLMGQVAGKLADTVIITSDNSRSESVESIMTEIERGVRDTGLGDCSVIADRAEAIAKAIGMAGTGDVVLIAGKGHENYQINRDGKVLFDDGQEAARQLKNKKG